MTSIIEKVKKSKKTDSMLIKANGNDTGYVAIHAGKAVEIQYVEHRFDSYTEYEIIEKDLNRSVVSDFKKYSSYSLSISTSYCYVNKADVIECQQLMKNGVELVKLAKKELENFIKLYF